jgi:hypothetical protein
MQNKDDINCHLLYFPQEMGIMEEKLVSMTKSQYFVTPGSDLPPCLTGGGGRDLQKPAFNTYYGARGIKYQYIYIAFIFQRSSC